MSGGGILDVDLVQGSVDGEVYFTQLVPHLLPYNGQNPNSIVVLDNYI